MRRRVISIKVRNRFWRVMIEPDPEAGFVGECPALLDCLAYGETYDAAKAGIKEAIEIWLDTKEQMLVKI